MRVALAIVAAIAGLAAGGLAAWRGTEPLAQWLDEGTGPCATDPEHEARAESLREQIRSLQGASP